MRRPFPLARRVIIVEDDADGLEALCELLEASGYEVSLAWNTTDALALTRAVRPDIVVMDLRLPDGDAFDVIRAIKTEKPAVTVVAFSGWLDGERPARAAGADWFVRKPDCETLKRVLACVRDGA